MPTVSCAKKFALATIRLYLVTSCELNGSPSSLSSEHPSLPRNLRSFKSCLFSSSVSRTVSFAASVEMVLSPPAPVSRLIISACLGSASSAIPWRGCHLTIRFSLLVQIIVLSFHFHLRRERLQAPAQPLEFRPLAG